MKDTAIIMEYIYIYIVRSADYQLRDLVDSM